MRILLPLSFAALLIAAGCSKDKDVEPPAKLVDFPQTLPVKNSGATASAAARSKSSCA
jgi:hypothetical protein